MYFKDEPLLIFDGACGSNIQTMNLPASAWDGIEGCNEYLNITAPEAIKELHGQFLDAGAMVLETNTFGASAIALREYGIEDKVEEINRKGVLIAKEAIGDRERRYVVGSIGPTAKLPTLGHVSVEELCAAVKQQATVLASAGVDGLIVETCQDLLQLKTAIIACTEVIEELELSIPILTSVTIEQQGTMLLGSDIGAVVATLDPFPVMSLGLNCATGPEAMESHISYLSENWKGRISCIPNQGLPELIDGKAVYPLSPKNYAGQMLQYVQNKGVSIVGGCCGTSPAHIAALASALQDELKK